MVEDSVKGSPLQEELVTNGECELCRTEAGYTSADEAHVVTGFSDSARASGPLGPLLHCGISTRVPVLVWGQRV